MNRSRLIFIGVAALALGVLASGWAYRDLQQRTGASHGGMQDVAVAAADIPVGERIQDKDVRIIQMPTDALPPSGFGSKKRLLGRGAILPIAQGEFFIAGKNLAAENGGAGLPSMIPSGMRAVSVRVNDGSAVGGFIQPRSRVDVLMTGTSASGEAQTMTILKNVEVLANGTRLDRNSSGGETQNSPLITLLVAPYGKRITALLPCPLASASWLPVPSLAFKYAVKPVSLPVNSASFALLISAALRAIFQMRISSIKPSNLL